MFSWVLLLLAAGTVALVLELMSFPAAALIGPMVLAIIFAVSGGDLRLHRFPFALAQGVTGCLVTRNLDAGTLDFVFHHVLLILLVTGSTLLIAILCGFILARISKLALRPALWGTMPGMASSILAIADAENVDTRIVAVILYLRVLAVISVVSLLSAVLASDMSMYGNAVPSVQPGLGSLLLTLAVVGLAGVAGYYQWFRAAAIFIPVILSVFLRLASVEPLYVPWWLSEIAFIFIGLQVGLRFRRDIVLFAMSILPFIVFSTFLVILLSAMVAMIMACLTGIDLMTAILSTIPGNFESVVALAIKSNADVSTVFAVQTTRLIVVILFGPLLVRLTLRLAERQT